MCTYLCVSTYVYVCTFTYICTLGMGVPTGIEPMSPAFLAGMGMLMGITPAKQCLYIHTPANYREVHLVLVFLMNT